MSQSLIRGLRAGISWPWPLTQRSQPTSVICTARNLLSDRGYELSVQRCDGYFFAATEQQVHLERCFEPSYRQVKVWWRILDPIGRSVQLEKHVTVAWLRPTIPGAEFDGTGEPICLLSSGQRVTDITLHQQDHHVQLMIGYRHPGQSRSERHFEVDRLPVRLM